MPRPLSIRDFRAVRIVLEPSEFLSGPEWEPVPTDVIDKDTWDGIMVLPDDVSIRTFNHNGRLLKMLYGLEVAWSEGWGEGQDCLLGAMLDAGDEFQAATFNGFHGYYRQAIACLRGALELVVIGTFCQLCAEPTEYARWREGERSGSAGRAIDSRRQPR